jgi:uncharacterized membrane protein YjdF
MQNISKINQQNVMPSIPLSYFRMPLVLLSVVAVVCIATVINPAAVRFNWFLEVGPGLVGIVILVLRYKRFPMSHMVYLCVFIHILILIYGGYYTYAETPLGNWAKSVFGFRLPLVYTTIAPIHGRIRDPESISDWAIDGRRDNHQF